MYLPRHFLIALSILIALSTLLLLIAGARVIAQVAPDSPDSRSEAPDQAGQDEPLNRELWEYARKTPYSDALRYIAQAQRLSRTEDRADVTLPNGWRISPAGRQVEVGRFPYEAIYYAGHIVVLNTGYYNKEAQEVSVVDPVSAQVVKVLHFESLFPSAQVGLDGDLYISGGFERKIYRLNEKFDVVRAYGVTGFAGGLAAIDRDHLAVTYMTADDALGNYAKGKLILLNTTTGQVDKVVNAGYYPYTVRSFNGKIYVTLLGENKLLVYDPKFDLLKTVEVGRSPQDICTAGEMLYVVNSGSDSLSVIETRSDSLVRTVDLHGKRALFGTAPTSCASDPQHLYVTQANTNSVVVLERNSERVVGFIPTGWYPTRVLAADNRLMILSAKGIHERRPNVDGQQPVTGRGGGQYVLTLLRGSLSIITNSVIPTNLRAWTRRVDEASPIFSPAAGFKLPVRHIFYIVKENRTYDQVLGDLGRGDGDPYLALFGKDVTPNHHRLANEFVTLDNYFADGEISVLGHSFTTSGYAGPFLEWLGNAQYSNRYKGYPFGMVPAVTSPAYLWDALDARGLDYRIYGENYYLYTRAYRIITEQYGADSELAQKFYAQMMALASKTDRGNIFFNFAAGYYGQAGTPADAFHLLEKPDFARKLSQFLCGDESLSRAVQENAPLRRKFAEFLYRYPFNYRSWDLRYSDIDRFLAWKTDFLSQIKAGKVSQLHYIWLPNDHTDGSRADIHTPFEFVAQNDLALGRIIETISKSAVWKESLILVTEDDAQNGPDHVDATRTVGLAAGPYVKRGVIVSDRYDQLSLLRTIELLLGLSPLNTNDAAAVPMFGIFSAIPDTRPYTPAQPSSYLSEADKQLYLKAGMD